MPSEVATVALFYLIPEDVLLADASGVAGRSNAKPKLIRRSPSVSLVPPRYHLDRHEHAVHQLIVNVDLII